jgi:hypothetical protein
MPRHANRDPVRLAECTDQHTDQHARGARGGAAVGRLPPTDLVELPSELTPTLTLTLTLTLALALALALTLTLTLTLTRCTCPSSCTEQAN